MEAKTIIRYLPLIVWHIPPHTGCDSPRLSSDFTSEMTEWCQSHATFDPKLSVKDSIHVKVTLFRIFRWLSHHLEHLFLRPPAGGGPCFNRASWLGICADYRISLFTYTHFSNAHDRLELLSIHFGRFRSEFGPAVFETNIRVCGSVESAAFRSRDRFWEHSVYIAYK